VTGEYIYKEAWKNYGPCEETTMNKIELERLNDFVKKHRTEQISRSNFLLAVEGTGVGTNYRITCLNCDKAQNISDYDHW